MIITQFWPQDFDPEDIRTTRSGIIKIHDSYCDWQVQVGEAVGHNLCIWWQISYKPESYICLRQRQIQKEILYIRSFISAQNLLDNWKKASSVGV
jgi:hypothetical protein